MRHLLSLDDLSSAELHHLIARAQEWKRLRGNPQAPRPLVTRSVAMLFSQHSTRTRVSFEVGIAELGGTPLYLTATELQLARGETPEDTARVLSRYVDALVVRTPDHTWLRRLADAATVPVINGLTPHSHPCQLLADLQTYSEHRGAIQGRTVAWIGAGNNVCNTWLQASRLLDFQLRIAVPESHEPSAEELKSCPDAEILHDPRAAVRGAALVVTDVWASLGQDGEAERHRHSLADYHVSRELMALAAPDALFMHCLPAHRGEEVEAELLDATDSVVWDEAENRLHAQKALLEFLLPPPTGDGREVSD